MTWQVVCRVGDSDDYTPVSRRADPRLEVAFGRSGDPSSMRQTVLSDIRRKLEGAPSQTMVDLLHASMAVFAADLCIPRECSPDGWTRSIRLHLAVAEPDRWQPVLPLLSKMLSFLSGDNWSVCTHRHEANLQRLSSSPLTGEPPDAVALFSGGLDSLVGAIDLLTEGQTVALVGQYGPEALPSEFQRKVWISLPDHLREQGTRLAFSVQPPPIPGGGSYDKTMRCRSLLFIALGLAVADTLASACPLYISENGFISLNVPLTNPRMGSLSTRTTHPYFTGLLGRVIDKLNLEHPIRLPYRFKTKGEMLSEASNHQALERSARHTMSCAHPTYNRWLGESPKKHCGYCFPCIVRRAAMEFAGLPDAEYVMDVVGEAPDPKLKSGRDLRAVAMAVRRCRRMSDIEAIRDVLTTGPISPSNVRDYARVYRRGLEELDELLSNEN